MGVTSQVYTILLCVSFYTRFQTSWSNITPRFEFTRRPESVTALLNSASLNLNSRFVNFGLTANTDKTDALKYPNLFQSTDEIDKLLKSRSISDNYVVTSYIERRELDPVCDTKVTEPSIYTLPTCPKENNFFIRNSVRVGLSDRISSAARPTCCTTSMAITVPNTVRSIIDGMSYQVKHLSSSFQLLHEGSCMLQGSTCGSSGRCRMAFRVQWVLVETGSGDTFVPVNVPNHCYCSNS